MIRRKPTKATNEEEVSEADRQLHQRIADEVKRKLQAKGESTEGVENFEAFYGMIRDEALKLQQEYQPQLRNGINLTFVIDKFKKVEQNKKIGWHLSIKPNHSEKEGLIVYKNIMFDSSVSSLIAENYVTPRSRQRKIPEVITETISGNYEDAYRIAQSKVGTTTKTLISKVGPEKGKVVGWGTQSCHYRLDWSTQLGVHLNWVTAREKGAIPINMTKEAYEQNIDRLHKNHQI